MPRLPLEGVRILDLSWLLPYTTILADLGAEVIKVEEPTRGDYGRYFPPLVGGVSTYFLAHNRSKKSVAINLRSEEGRRVFYDLVKVSDVVVESFRPGVVKRLSVDYETIKRYNPRIVYCSISGYGQESPYSQLPGHDINYMAMAGFLDLLRDKKGRPIVPAVNIADMATCLYVAIAVLAALLHREKTGEGQYIDISLHDAAFSLLTMPIAHYAAMGSLKGFPLTSLPHYGVYETKDGGYITIGILEKRFWENFCKAIGREDLIDKFWPASEEEARVVADELRKVFRQRTREEWFRLLSEADVPCAPLLTISEALSGRQARARGLVATVRYSGRDVPQLMTPIKFSNVRFREVSPPPSLGGDTEEVLVSLLGYSRERVEDLRRRGIIR